MTKTMSIQTKTTTTTMRGTSRMRRLWNHHILLTLLLLLSGAPNWFQENMSTSLPSTTTTRTLSLIVEAASDDGTKVPEEHGRNPMDEKDDCPVYRCPNAGWEVVPVWPLELTFGSCNTLSGLVDVQHAPDQDKNDPIDPCCHERTACYQTCGMPKQYCDHQFNRCVDVTCGNFQDDEDEKECQKTASLHKMLARMGNCQLYHQTQEKQCECFKFMDAPAKRREFLETLYQQHKAESLHKVDGIIDKTGDNAVKFATVVTKLVAKHGMVQRVREDEDVTEMIRREGKEKYEEDRRKEWKEKKMKPKEKYYLYDDDDEDGDGNKKNEL